MGRRLDLQEGERSDHPPTSRKWPGLEELLQRGVRIVTQPRGELPEIDERKLEVVREMLRNGFPGWAVEDAVDELDRATRFFSVRQGREPRHRLSVSREFFDDHPLARIEPLLQSWRLVGALKQAGLRLVVVGSIGVHIGG